MIYDDLIARNCKQARKEPVNTGGYESRGANGNNLEKLLLFVAGRGTLENM